MKPTGGLKLRLHTAARDDRRVRFARVEIAGGGERVALVTDASGRLRYRLPAGDYQLALGNAPEAPFAVREHGWTPVRVQLP